MPLRSFYERFVVNFGKGLSTRNAPDATGENELREAVNVAITGQGFLSPRKSYKDLFTPVGTPQGVFRFPFGTCTIAAAGSYGVGGILATNNAGTLELYPITTSGALGDKIGNVGTIPGDYPYRTVQLTAALINSKLFIADEARRLPLVIYDPSRAAGSQIVTPEFDFDGDYDPVAVTGDKGKMYPRVTVEYNNMVFTAGYGDEKNTNRPEIIRFSYLGLYDPGDGKGGGDAAKDKNGSMITGSMLGVFAKSDYFMVTERGTPVVAMAPAAGRLLIATPFSTYTLFGYDRNSFQVELLDNQRGCTTTRAMVAAHGTVYWWSNNGPVRYTGSGVEEIGADIREKFAEVNQTVFAFHNEDAEEVMWIFEANEDAFITRALCYNYRYGTWTQRDYYDQWFCAGTVSPVYADLTSGATSAPAGPSAAPTLYSASNVTESSAVSNWTNGDTSAHTEVYLNDVLQGKVDPGVTSYKHTGLASSASYTVKLRHVKNGQASAYLSGTFTTQATGFTPNAPVWKSTDKLTIYSGSEIDSTVSYAAHITWELGQTGVKTKVYRGTVSTFVADATSLIGTTEYDKTDYKDENLAAGTYHYKISHINSSDVESSIVAAGSVTV